MGGVGQLIRDTQSLKRTYSFFEGRVLRLGGPSAKARLGGGSLDHFDGGETLIERS